jgi:tripeptide aminopeptidase
MRQNIVGTKEEKRKYIKKMEKVLDKFLRYVAVETTSNPESESFPSANCEFDLLKLLVEELGKMGIEAQMDQYGYVMATIPSNIDDAEVPSVGFIAHVDTAPDASGKDIKPQIIENYNGESVALGESGRVLWLDTFPHLASLKGRTLITTDGTTLLGADDKA